jgi:dipeptidyl-peptidase-4
MKWLDGGKRFLWVSERDGWRRPYSVAADGSDMKPLTKGAFDAMSISRSMKSAAGSIILLRPIMPTQRYLYRSRLDGSGNDERVTPADIKGWNNYSISPTSKWAIQSSSSFGHPSRIDLLKLSDKTVARNVVANNALRQKVDQLAHGTKRVLSYRRWRRPFLDGWMMKPPGFDPAKKVSRSLLCLYRARRYNGKRFLERVAVSVVPDADPAGVYCRQC